MLRLLALLLLPLVAACATTAERPATTFASDRISIEVRGSGPDVVLIPGLSSHPDVWASTAAAVPGYRYHLIHVAGFAGKPAGANASGPVVAPVAEEIARYIREAGLERPALVGHSMGGSWAMLVAARHPDLVSRVMIVDMLPYLGPVFAGPNAAPEGVRAMAEQMRRGMASATGEARRRAIEQFVTPMIRTESLRPRIIEDSLRSDQAVASQAFYEVVVTDLRPELRNIRVPLTVLYVRPPNVPLTEVQFDEAYRLAYANAPQTVLKRIPEAWHFIMLDQPEVFQRELRQFLQHDQ